MFDLVHFNLAVKQLYNSYHTLWAVTPLWSISSSDLHIALFWAAWELIIWKWTVLDKGTPSNWLLKELGSLPSEICGTAHSVQLLLLEKVFKTQTSTYWYYTHLVTSVARNKHLLGHGLDSTSASCHHQITRAAYWLRMFCQNCRWHTNSSSEQKD